MNSQSNFDAPLRFDRFMQMALYDPLKGYYSRGNNIFGARGDFITAPELSPLFGQTLANGIQQLVEETGGVIYEFGAGRGKLACHLLQSLGDSLKEYRIIELSAGLRIEQAAQLKNQLPPQLSEKVVWLDELPDQLRGVLLGNEVLDACPVRRFEWSASGVKELWAVPKNGHWEGHYEWADPNTYRMVKSLQEDFGPWPDGYCSEWSEQAAGLISTLTERLEGVAIMIDYGYEGTEYYAPARTHGTLRAHYRHVAHDGYFERPGQQDLTAHVNFSSVYQAILGTDGQLEGYCTQKDFLLGLGIIDFAAKLPTLEDPVKGGKTRQALQTLLGESDMGELFKVVCWSKNHQLNEGLLRQIFIDKDRSGRL